MFDITFLGASGGPVEGTNCSLLIKPSSIDYSNLQDDSSHDDLVIIDGGLGVRRLAEIISNLKDNPRTNDHVLSTSFYPDALTKEEATKAQLIEPFKSLSKDPYRNAWGILNKLTNYLITHPHLDHISGLAINTAGFAPDSHRAKVLHGSPYTIRALGTHIFNGIIWPNMPLLGIVKLDEQQYDTPFEMGNYIVKMFELLHGKIVDGDEDCPIKKINTKRTKLINLDINNIDVKISNGHLNCSQKSDNTYLSLAFLLEHKLNQESVLVFGDFEADKMLGLDRNIKIWHQIAPLVNLGTLRAIVLECSQCVCHENNLYGHLMPRHLIEELKVLERECQKQNKDNNNESVISSPLKDFDILVNHVKESMEGLCPRRKILDTLNALNKENNLGINFTIALSGVSVRV